VENSRPEQFRLVKADIPPGRKIFPGAFQLQIQAGTAARRRKGEQVTEIGPEMPVFQPGEFERGVDNCC